MPVGHKDAPHLHPAPVAFLHPRPLYLRPPARNGTASKSPRANFSERSTKTPAAQSYEDQLRGMSFLRRRSEALDVETSGGEQCAALLRSPPAQPEPSRGDEPNAGYSRA